MSSFVYSVKITVLYFLDLIVLLSVSGADKVQTREFLGLNPKSHLLLFAVVLFLVKQLLTSMYDTEKNPSNNIFF